MEGLYGNYSEPPEFRADPFQTYVQDGQVIAGFIAVVAPARGKRPRELYPSRKKPIDKKNEKNLLVDIATGKETGIVVATDKGFFQDPFENNIKARYNTIEAGAITILNKFPLFSKDKQHIPNGIMLVTFPTIPIHFPKENHEAVSSLLMSVKNALKNLRDLHGSSYQIINFFNIGSNSGASLKQLHSQSYFWKHELPIQGKDQIPFYKTYEQRGCLACKLASKREIEDVFGSTIEIKERIIYENPDVIVFFAYSPIRMLQVRVMPKRHVANLLDLSREEISSLAIGISVADNAIFQVSSALNFQIEDRSVAFRERYDGDFHMLVDILPAWPLAGAELVTSMTFASRSPEQAAILFNEINGEKTLLEQ